MFNVENCLWVVASIVLGVTMLFLVGLSILWRMFLLVIFRFWDYVRLVSWAKKEFLSMLGYCSLRMGVSMTSSLILHIAPLLEVAMMQMHSQI